MKVIGMKCLKKDPKSGSNNANTKANAMNKINIEFNVSLSLIFFLCKTIVTKVKILNIKNNKYKMFPLRTNSIGKINLIKLIK